MRALMSLLIVLLVACAGNSRQVDMAVHDLGMPAGNWEATGIAIAAVEVQGRSPLASTAMHYRLEYADATRRLSYAENRWAAPPAELLEKFLTRRIVFGQRDVAASGCRLRLGLDDLTQNFDGVRSSAINLETRAVLLSARGEEMLAQRAFQMRLVAPTPDARGGVLATRAALQSLADELNRWLAEVARARPSIAARCG